MADEQPVAEARAGDRRGAERRTDDRRQNDRRAPLPWWRKPAALIGGGVLAGTLLAFLLFGGDDAPPAPDDELTTRTKAVTPAEVEPTPPQPAAAAAEDAYGAAGFERLVLQAESAVGRVVRTELYCEAPSNVVVSTGVRTEAAVAALVQQGTIPAAECKWGRRDDPRREDFLLLVPPALAGQFASAPVSNDAYVERRRVVAEVEWVGRSEALALRTAGVFRGLVR